MPLWEVHSFQLNIDEGDCAVHLLVDRNVTPKDIKKAVLIDGGKEYGSECIWEFRYILGKKDSGYSQGTGSMFRHFDAIVITHWDSDHRAGIVKALQYDIEEAAREAIKFHNVDNQEEFEEIIAAREVQGKLTIYGGPKGGPSSVIYAPYWLLSESETKRNYEKTGKEHADEWERIYEDGQAYVGVKVTMTSVTGNKIKGVIPVALLKCDGLRLLGYDFFTGSKIMPGGQVETSPATVSRYLSTLPTSKPVMMCVAADSWVCDPAGMADRSKNWQWSYANFDMTEIQLIRTQTASRSDADHGHQTVRDLPSSSNGISVQSVKGFTTGNNQASIACMVIWPHADCDISLYLGGDLGDLMEEQVLRWSTTPTDTNVRRTAPRVQSIKLSHHGAKFSTPALMLLAWKPHTIVASNGMRANFNHVSWETTYLCMAYTYWYNAVVNTGAYHRPFLTTNYPIYLTKFLVGNGVNYINPGAIDSVTESVGDTFRDVTSKMWDVVFAKAKTQIDPPRLPENLIAFFYANKDLSPQEAKNHICQYLGDWWRSYSLVPEYLFGGFEGFNDGVYKAAGQTIRFLAVKHAARGNFMSHYWFGDTFLEIDMSWVHEIAYANNNSGPSHDKRIQRVSIGPPVNNKTQRNPRTYRLGTKRVTGRLLEPAVAQVLSTAAPDVQSGQKLIGFNAPLELVPHRATLAMPESHRGRHRVKRRRFVDDAQLCYFMATDAIGKGSIKTVKAKTDSNLDLFLSGLVTGAFVLPDKLTGEAQELEVDRSDEMFQWLLLVYGDLNNSDFILKIRASTANISSFSYTTSLSKAAAKTITFSDPKLLTVITFSTDNNESAFGNQSGALPWCLGSPPNGAVDSDIDIIGPGIMLIMSLSSNSGIEKATITGKEIIDLFGLDLPTSLGFLAALTNFMVDTSTGSKCALWFFPDAVYTTVLRLQFKGADGDPASALASKIKDTIRDITSVVNLHVGDSRIVAKKAWRRSQQPAKSASVDFESTVIITTPVTFRRQPKTFTLIEPKLESFTVNTAIEVAKDQTNFILTFDTKKGGTAFIDLFEFFVSLLPGNPELPDLGGYLPGIQIDNILLRRITYTVPFQGSAKAVKVDLQASWASVVLQCTLSFKFGAGGGAELGGSLFPNDQVDGRKGRFTFVPFMPEYETWSALPFVPKTDGSEKGKQIGDLGDIYSTLTKAEGSEKKLQNAPTSLQLLSLGFHIDSQNIMFKATVISPSPEKDSVPQIRLSSATLDLVFMYKKTPQLKRLVFSSNCVLQARNSDDYATIGASLEYAANKWTLTGSAGRLSGGLLYSLFDNDSNEEMVEILKHISLDVTIRYNYDSTAKGSDFAIWGGLFLGPVTLDYKYDYKGKTASRDEAVWTLDAGLSVDQGNGTLVDVIAAICGTETSALLPSWLKTVGVKTSGDKKLTSLSVKDKGNFVFFALHLKLIDGASIHFYRLSPKKKSRNNSNDDKPPVTKTALVLTVDSLPSVENIPLIGTLPQPFDELDFIWVSSNDHSSGFTRADMKAINDPAFRYKDNVKEDQKSETDVLLAPGYHFIVVANGKVVLGYNFGGKSNVEHKEKPKSMQLTSAGELPVGSRSITTSPINKTFGPVKILGLGLGFDLNTNTLSIVVDGTLTLGPLAMTLLGFAVNFSFEGKDVSLRNLKSVTPSFDLRGLGASFQKDPVLLQGMFERGITSDGDAFFQGAATVGFTPYLFQAVGYYGKARDPVSHSRLLLSQDETFNTFFTYCRLDGPIMTIFGFAEITGLSGGFGYNSTITFPDTQNLLSFPFIAPPDETDPSKALYQFFNGGWFSPRRDSYWIAAGFKVLAFEMLEAEAVLTVEFGASLKFGVFGLATAEMPKKGEKKFVRVQLGLAATVDFDAGVMKIDGQLTPSSFVLDPNCHLTGGFAMYSWFDSRDPALDGDWVFTVGGYHKSFKVPTQYPVPPRLGITWSFDDSINITGESYFAINSKVCMGGGRLHIVMNAGPLYAYFDAYADFLINYKPFHFQAEGGISVGVHFTLDLWLVTIQINIDLAARLYLQGPPVNGTVHVDFYVFGFDVNFGQRQVIAKSKLELDDFYDLVLQADNKETTKSLFLQEDSQVADDKDKDVSPHIFSCTSGLIPSGGTVSSPNDMVWNVRGSIFAFDITCKFALTGAEVITKTLEKDGKDAKHSVNNDAKDSIYAKPMQLSSPFFKSQLVVTIAKDVPAVWELVDEESPLNPEWNNNTSILTSVPTALWGTYNEADDPSAGNNDIANLLDGTKGGTAKLMTGVSIHAPKSRLSDKNDKIAEFDVQTAMGKVAGLSKFPCKQDAQEAWQPLPKSSSPYADIRNRWNSPFLCDGAGVQAVNEWCKYAAFQWDASKISGARPEKLIQELEQHYTEPPRLSSDKKPDKNPCEPSQAVFGSGQTSVESSSYIVPRVQDTSLGRLQVQKRAWVNGSPDPE